MRPRRIAFWVLAALLAVALLPAAALLPRDGAVEAGGVLGGGWSWGDDSNRQLGNGVANDGNSSNVPVQVLETVGTNTHTNIIAVSSGSAHRACNGLRVYGRP